jgi:3-hydroxy-9,10-secoandrosta-1,3,5(10)-triene-9,17-dione monooxygenase
MAMTTPRVVPTTDEFVDSIENLLPLLKRNAAQGEQELRLTEETHEALREAGVFRMAVPRRFGGYQSDLRQQFEVCRTIARGDVSASWVAATAYVLAWWTAHFPDEVQEEIWQTPDVQISGVVKPGGQLVPVDGGYRLSGQWPFNTGCRHASWDIVTSLVTLDDGTMEPYLVIAPMSDFKILDDWKVAGMSATGSNSVVADDLFIPANRAFRMFPALTGDYPSEASKQETLYECALMPTLFSGSYGTALGGAQGMLETFLEWIPKRTISWESFDPQREAQVTHLKVAEAAMKIESGLLIARQGTDLIWDRAINKEPMSVAERVRARVNVAYTTRLSREAAEILWAISGGGAAHERAALQRYFRNLEVVCNHGVLDPDCNMTLFGRTLVGLEPQTPFL